MLKIAPPWQLLFGRASDLYDAGASISFQLSTISNRNSAASFPFAVRNAKCSPCISTVAARTYWIASLLSRTKNVLFGMQQYAPNLAPEARATLPSLLLSCWNHYLVFSPCYSN
jgi:hypothetical protein